MAVEETVISLISGGVALLGAFGVMVTGYLLVKPILNEAFECTQSKLVRIVSGLSLAAWGAYLVSKVVSILAGFQL